MIRLDSVYPPRLQLKVGDVLMVHRECYDKDKDETYTWKFLGAVAHVKGGRIKVLRFEEGDKEPISLSVHDPKYQVWFYPEDRWPDGVHAFRTRLILEGRLDGAIL